VDLGSLLSSIAHSVFSSSPTDGCHNATVHSIENDDVAGLDSLGASILGHFREQRLALLNKGDHTAKLVVLEAER
jgi:hypothetical protein